MAMVLHLLRNGLECETLTQIFQGHSTTKLRSESDMCQFGMYPQRCVYKPNMNALGITLTEEWTRM